MKKESQDKVLNKEERLKFNREQQYYLLLWGLFFILNYQNGLLYLLL